MAGYTTTGEGYHWVRLVEKDSSWRDEAACKGIPAKVFFPEKGYSEPEARKIREDVCGDCPVKQQCLEFGLDELDGFWGGVGPKDRRPIKRLAPKKEKPIKHGTYPGYITHLDRGEVPCAWCSATATQHLQRSKFNNYVREQESA